MKLPVVLNAGISACLLLAGTAFAEIVINTDHEIEYATGGVGVSEREGLDALAPDYGLKLVFALEGSGSFLSAVEVSISRGDEVVFQAADTGPWLLIALPAGTYRVIAQSHGHTREADVRVPEIGRSEATLHFPAR
ncbi:MAG: hypothetical protein K9L70_06205 [Thiohalocapsa sp.]|nr:hypothetical protein [Thiohalocapsa sp.]MCF7989926.1 hypothetical protein [Thiohalocapsa sp.]